MRTKKLFSLLLAVLMLCSLSVSAFAAETAQASVPVVLTVVNSVSPISVSVPACLPVTVLDGYVVTASNAVIENHAQSGAVQVVAVDVQPGAFAIGDFENFGSEAGKIAFSINGCKTVKEGNLPAGCRAAVRPGDITDSLPGSVHWSLRSQPENRSPR